MKKYITSEKRAGYEAQVEEFLPSTCKALTLNPSTAKKINNNNKKLVKRHQVSNRAKLEGKMPGWRQEE
jgi:hypothetical protein